MKASNTGEEQQYAFDLLLEAGKMYDAVVLKTEQKYSGNGNEMIVLSLGIETPAGGVRVDYFAVETVPNFVGPVVRAFYPDQVAAWEAGGEIEMDAKEAVGQRCRIRIKHETFEGTKRNKVAALFPTGEPSFDQSQPADTQPTEPTQPTQPTQPVADDANDGWEQ